jgi:hypothetical protein
LSRQGKLSYRNSYENELADHAKQVEKLDTLIENLCEDKAAGLIPASLYKRQILKYEQDRTKREAVMKALKKRIVGLPHPAAPDSTSAWRGMIKQVMGMEIPDTDTLRTLIDKIIVHQAQIIDGRRICDIEVVYKYRHLK